MRVARLHGRGDIRLHDEPDPVPGGGSAASEGSTPVKRHPGTSKRV